MQNHKLQVHCMPYRVNTKPVICICRAAKLVQGTKQMMLQMQADNQY